MTTTENRYLMDNYAPVADELTVRELPVTGSLPDALCGRYLRNGPNPLSPPEPSTYHWFTGEGMVHGIQVPRRPSRVVPEPMGTFGRGGSSIG